MSTKLGYESEITRLDGLTVAKMVRTQLLVSERTCEFIAMLDRPDVTIIYLTTPTATAPLRILPLISPPMRRTPWSLINRHASIGPEPTPSSPPPPPPRQSTHSSLTGYALVSSRALPWSCRAWLAFLPSGYAHVASRPWPCGSANTCVREENIVAL